MNKRIRLARNPGAIGESRGTTGLGAEGQRNVVEIIGKLPGGRGVSAPVTVPAFSNTEACRM